MIILVEKVFYETMKEVKSVVSMKNSKERKNARHTNFIKIKVPLLMLFTQAKE